MGAASPSISVINQVASQQWDCSIRNSSQRKLFSTGVQSEGPASRALAADVQPVDDRPRAGGHCVHLPNKLSLPEKIARASSLSKLQQALQ